MNKNIYLIIIYLHVTLFVSATSFSGIIINKSNSDPISYAYIGIPGKNIGVISALNGRFKINIPSNSFNDTLKVSSIGYKDIYIPIIELDVSEIKIIKLEKVVFELPEIAIKKKVGRRKRIGCPYNHSNKLVMIPFKPDFYNYGRELGVFVKNKRKLSLLNVHYKIGTYTKGNLDTVLFRLNIYSVKGAMKYLPEPPTLSDGTWEFKGEYIKHIRDSSVVNILNEPIYFIITPDCIFPPLANIDLRPFNISLEGDFIVAFEFLYSSKPCLFLFGGKYGSNGCGKYNHFCPWIKNGNITPAFSVDVLVDKTK